MRPLHLLKLDSGKLCPKTVSTRTQFGQAAGHGSVLAVITPDSNHGILGTSRHDGRDFGKVLWVVEPEYKGILMIRGAQVDGAGNLLFGEIAPFSSELRLPLDAVPSSDGTYPSTVSVSNPGCYEFQVDGVTFSSFIVFQVS